MFKDGLGGIIIKEFCALRAKAYSYLKGDDSKVKKTKGTKKYVIKRGIMFEKYTDCLFKDKIIYFNIVLKKIDLRAIITKSTVKKLIRLH